MRHIGSRNKSILVCAALVDQNRDAEYRCRVHHRAVVTEPPVEYINQVGFRFFKDGCCKLIDYRSASQRILNQVSIRDQIGIA